MAKQINKKLVALDATLMLVITAVGILVLYTIMHTAGPSWDISARYLNGRTLLNFLTHKIDAQAAFVGEFANNQLYYFEPYREPLSTPVFALLLLFFKNPVLPYVLLIFAGFLLALYEFGKELRVDGLVVFSVFINSYMLYFLFIVNGGEGLSIIFVLLALVLLLRKSPISGLFFGIASVAKYPALALFPMVLLLNDRKKVIYALVLEALPVLIWGGIDYLIYGVPFYSYIASASNASVVSIPSSVYIGSLVQVMAYPAVFAAIGVAFLIKNREKIRIRIEYNSKIFVALIILSGLGYAAILPHNDPVTQARYGFLFSFALLASAVLILNRVVQESERLKYMVAAGAIVMLAASLCFAYVTNGAPSSAYYNSDNQNSVYVHSATVLSGLGFGSCRFVSNAWIPMLYSGYDAYSPFVLYSSNTIDPIIARLLQIYELNHTTFPQEPARYPIIAFNYTGVPQHFILNLNQSQLVYSDKNITVYIPKNASCYKN